MAVVTRRISPVSTVDLTGEHAGIWVAVSSTGKTDEATTSRIWLIRCTQCGVERHLSLSLFRRYQREGRGYRCQCQTDHALRQPRVERPSKTPTIVEPKRKPSKFCHDCGTLPHRVQGIKCRGCGLRYCEMGPIAIEIPGLQSSMARALDFAPSGGGE